MKDSGWPSGLSWHLYISSLIKGLRGEDWPAKELFGRSVSLAKKCGNRWLESLIPLSKENAPTTGTATEHFVESLNRFNSLLESKMAVHAPMAARTVIHSMVDCRLDELAAKLIPIAQKLPGIGSRNEYHTSFPTLVAELEVRLGKGKFASLQAIGQTLSVEDMLVLSKQAAERLRDQRKSKSDVDE